MNNFEDAPDEPIELIGTTESVAASHAEQPEVVQNNARSNLALIVGALALVGVIFSIVSSPSDDVDSADSDRPSVTEPQAPVSVDITPGVQPGDGPVLGRETALSLVVGGSNTPFRVLDLDTGDLVVSETVLAPQFIAGSMLIYVSDTMTWSAIELSQLGESSESGTPPSDEAGRSFSPLGTSPLVVPADDDTVWLTWSRTDGGRDWQLIDLESFDVLRQVSTPIEVRIPGGAQPFSGPEVVGSEAGGVFELQEDNSYEQVLEGVLVAVGDTSVLVRQCSPTLECVARWFARDTWVATDRPPPKADLANGRLVAGGLLLAGAVPQPALGAGLYDVESGQILRSLGPAPLSGAVVSPDGRWLVRRLLGRVEVVDVLDGQSTVVLNLDLGRGDSILWVETSSLR